MRGEGGKVASFLAFWASPPPPVQATCTPKKSGLQWVIRLKPRNAAPKLCAVEQRKRRPHTIPPDSIFRIRKTKDASQTGRIIPNRPRHNRESMESMITIHVTHRQSSCIMLDMLDTLDPPPTRVPAHPASV